MRVGGASKEVIGFHASSRSAYATGSSLTVDKGPSLMAAHGQDSAGASWRAIR